MKYSLITLSLFTGFYLSAQQTGENKNIACTILSPAQGHALTVNIDVYTDSSAHEKLIKVIVYDSVTTKTVNYFVKTNSGSITIASCGGNGANGKDGIDGFDGMDGLSGLVTNTIVPVADGGIDITQQGTGGNGYKGSDGANGENGSKGYDGGNITIIYTAAAKPYLNLIHTISRPGLGGFGGRGGNGGRGGRGGDGNPSGINGINGANGVRGINGPIGNKGKVTFKQQ
ncbi:MAG TPA: hypothetical protein VK890_05645 [Bacteroidia bacterium]|jgi:hypothetical protein|nr:hypothetical protein [Bacteroidia bacterium]